MERGSQWSPHGLKPVPPPHASQGGTLRSKPRWARVGFVGYPPRIHPRSQRPCLRAEVPAFVPPRRDFAQAGATARRRGLLRRRVKIQHSSAVNTQFHPLTQSVIPEIIYL